ncbi:hypothetical protein GGR50DRAFT_234187 [Xylaria sp. CBS 124048]|nr:hypothetical protein GGR50DRAFT_234187 [Xylaria sp. CBS 124048]
MSAYSNSNLYSYKEQEARYGGFGSYYIELGMGRPLFADMATMYGDIMAPISRPPGSETGLTAAQHSELVSGLYKGRRLRKSAARPFQPVSPRHKLHNVRGLEKGKEYSFVRGRRSVAPPYGKPLIAAPWRIDSRRRGTRHNRKRAVDQWSDPMDLDTNMDDAPDLSWIVGDPMDIDDAVEDDGGGVGVGVAGIGIGEVQQQQDMGMEMEYEWASDSEEDDVDIPSNPMSRCIPPLPLPLPLSSPSTRPNRSLAPSSAFEHFGGPRDYNTKPKQRRPDACWWLEP